MHDCIVAMSSKLFSETSACPEYQDLVTIPDIDMKWKELGTALMIDPQSLDAIEKKHTQSARRKRDLFRLAVKNGVTWKQVIKGLSDVGLRDVARRVCTLYDIPLNGLSVYVNSVSIIMKLFISRKLLCYAHNYCLHH